MNDAPTPVIAPPPLPRAQRRRQRRPRVWLRLILVLLFLAVIGGGLIGFHQFKSNILKQVIHQITSQLPVVATVKATVQDWQPELSATGTLRASNGADLSAEVGGIVGEIHFDSGQDVEAGQLLLRLRPNDDDARLQQLQATADLAQITYERDVRQLRVQGVSQAAVDTDLGNLKSARAQVAAQQALMAEKFVRAPFAGRLGVRQVDLGQYLSPGTAVVTLQALDPIFADFFLPQQALAQLRVGQAVTVRSDTYPGRGFAGTIAAISPKVDPASRMVQVRASLANPDRALLPGMYITVAVDAGAPQKLVTLPQTAVTYNPYGSLLVYKVQQQGTDASGKPNLMVTQQFVTTGPTRGDQVAIVKGVSDGDEVVTSGQLKLHNNMAVLVNNSVLPTDNPIPRRPDISADRPVNFTDIFIRRPVLASVVSLLILVVGIRAFYSLQVLEYPKTENAVITVATTYYGADAETMAGFVTTPLENAIAQANGIDYMSSVSQAGLSTITLNLRLNYDSNRAMTEVNAKINSVINQLPAGAQQPTMTVKVGQSLDALIIGFASDQIGPNQITDYLTRNVQPALQAVPGVQTAEFFGPKNFALRAWLDPQKLAAYKLTATDVTNALAANDYIAGVGATKGQMIQVNLSASTNLHTADEFRNLVVSQVNGGIIRLGDVANVVLGADDYDSQVSFDGKTGVYIGIQIVPSANLLSVIDGVKAVLPGIFARLPAGLTGDVIYDSTAFVNSSINEVARTLIEALAIVTLVVFAFLGSPRSVVIPVVAIPLSLVGTFAMMLLFGFSVNLLTLLALVLAIGLVVDDAIIVVESVNRHLEEGMTPFEAAIRAARDLASPIIAMTVVLVAVYVPIGFQGGLTGALFTEFAFTLVGAVTVSAVIALTLSPMMCSLLLKPYRPDSPDWQDRLVAWMDRGFGRLRRGYERALRGSLATLPVTLLFTAVVLGGIYFLYTTSDSQLAPDEDQGVVILIPFSAPDATLQQKLLFGSQVEQIMTAVPEGQHTFQVASPAMSIAGVTLKPWDQRTRGAVTIQRDLQNKLASVTGQRIVAFLPPPLPGADGLPIQLVLKSSGSLAELNAQSQAFLAEAQKSGLFLFLDNDLKVDLPQYEVDIDRDKAAQLGLNMSKVGGAMASLLGGGYVNYFSLGSRSYKVIPQVEQVHRLNGSQVLNYQVATVNDVPVPLSAVATLKTQTVPETLNHFQQINSATIAGVAAPGVSQQEALAYLQDLAKRTLPATTVIDEAGQLRQFVQESSGFVGTFAFALIVIFLALAALFESFRDPLIILISVPMSIAGALLFINLGIGGASLNIYTEVGLVTLMGLISKHGILMVEVANMEQAEGKSKLEAIVAAAGIRLRPILMTTAAMVLGVIPLIVATGAGAASRFNMGLVIASGLAIGTVFTLFVVPAVYVAIAARHRTA